MVLISVRRSALCIRAFSVTRVRRRCDRKGAEDKGDGAGRKGDLTAALIHNDIPPRDENDTAEAAGTLGARGARISRRLLIAVAGTYWTNWPL